MKKNIITAACIGILLITTAFANLIDMGNVTRDTSTGLDWLDLTQTAGMSYNQVTQQLVPGGSFAGYRYATLPEIEGFLTSAGGTAPFLGSAHLPLNGWVTALRALWGTTNNNPGNTYSVAMWGSPVVATWEEYVYDPETGFSEPVEVTGQKVQTGILQDWYDGGFATARFGFGEYFEEPVDYSASHLGSALVKDSPYVAPTVVAVSPSSGPVNTGHLSAFAD